jgi:hypothetical protein
MNRKVIRTFAILVFLLVLNFIFWENIWTDSLQEQTGQQDHQEHLHMEHQEQAGRSKARIIDTLKSIRDPDHQRKRIIGMLRHAWDGYEKFAFGADHLLPISKTRNDWLKLGLTILDTLDTAFIMGQMDIYHKCRIWIKEEFQLNANQGVSIFETNIRVVGGFLSAYALTDDDLFLEKAIQV